MKKIINFLDNMHIKSAKRYEEKRRKKIKKLMYELYREGALFKCRTDNLDILKKVDIKENIEYRWFVDYTKEFMNE